MRMSVEHRLALASALPKVDLHVHFEGLVTEALYRRLSSTHSLEAEEGIFLAGYENLPQFIEAIRRSNRVIQNSQDCEEIVFSYANAASTINLRHVELAIEPSFHNQRGLSTKELFDGIEAGFARAEHEFGLTHRLILSVALDLPPSEALRKLNEAEDLGIRLGGVGIAGNVGARRLASFAPIMELASSRGYSVVAHAGETGAPSEIWEAIEEFPLARIDHGCTAMQDPQLIEFLRETNLPLAMAPVSNHVSGASRFGHAAATLLREGLCVSLNSDDPGTQSSNLLDDFRMLIEHQDLSCEEIVRLALNGFEASFLDEERKLALIAEAKNLQRNFEEKRP